MFKGLNRVINKALGRSEPISDQPVSRKVYFNRPDSTFPTNLIRTSKYTLLTFIPINLYIQFSNFVNIYFLIISIIQFIPGASPVGIGTTIVPLTAFVTIAMLHEAYDDHRRHQMDHEENFREVLVQQEEKNRLGGGLDISMEEMEPKFQLVEWHFLKVGDIVKLRSDEWIPSDVLILSSSNPSSIAYLETAALDGETSLKKIQPVKPIRELIAQSGHSSLKGYLEVEEPTDDLYKIDGNIYLDDGQQFPLSMGQVMLRGSILRNTKEVVAMVMYNGEHTKVRLNANRNVQAKLPILTKTMNRTVIIAFTMLILLAGLATGLNLGWSYTEGVSAWYLGQTRPRVGSTVLNFLGFVIILNTIVPISLFVSLEFCKLFQAYFILQDHEMYHKPTNTKAQFHTSSLNDDLGMVNYIFSDKTGTLTENSMHFRKLYTNKGCYSHDFDNIFFGGQGSEVRMPLDEVMLEKVVANDVNLALDSFKGPAFSVLAMALCHTVESDRNKDGDITYQATSPDELALVQGAQQVGLVFGDRDSHQLTLMCDTTNFMFQQLEILEFTSDRKRMSTVLRLPNNKLLLLSKGADSSMLPLMLSMKKEEELVQNCLYYYSCLGLRTLVYGYKELNEETYLHWKKNYQLALDSLDSNRNSKLEELAQQLENGLTLIGVTALEDRLQQGVPETISKLQKAGIKIWVLTGDKRETAINIGRSCSLLPTGCELVVLDLNKKDLNGQLSEGLRELRSNTCLVIDGATFAYLENENSFEMERFLELAMRCVSIILCRSSPAQKASVVRLVRSRDTSKVTLAIGDGGNDVSMIQEAHLGIGISGNEGLMAARSSDYSIAQFRYLQPLLLVHGHWNYFRTSKFILLTFYKSMVFYLAQYIYQIFTAYTGTSWYETWSFSLYNALFTLLPIMAIGTLEKNYPRHVLLAHPELYKLGGPNNTYFNIMNYIGTIILSWFHAAIIASSFFLMKIWVGPNLPPDGTQMFHMGMSVYFITVLTVSIYVAILSSHNCTSFHILFVILSIIAYLLTQIILSSSYSLTSEIPMRNSFRSLMASPSLWLPLIFSLGTVISFKCMYRLISAELPGPYEILKKVRDIFTKRKNKKEPLPSQDFESDNINLLPM